MIPNATYRITPGERLFDPLCDLLTIFTAMTHASYAELARYGLMPPRGPGEPATTLGSVTHEQTVAFHFRDLFEAAMRGERPPTIKILMFDRGAELIPPPNTSRISSGVPFQGMAVAIGKAAFLIFFERYNEWLTATYGDAINWPMTLNFARVVRNAIAHGAINIRAKSAPPVKWKSLSYDYHDSGKRVIPNDLDVGDLVALMLEADEELERLNAPIL